MLNPEEEQRIKSIEERLKKDNKNFMDITLIIKGIINIIDKKVDIDDLKIKELNKELSSITNTRNEDVKKTKKYKWIFCVIFLLLFRAEITTFLKSAWDRFYQAQIEWKIFILSTIIGLIFIEWSNIKRCFRIILSRLSRIFKDKRPKKINKA